MTENNTPQIWFWSDTHFFHQRIIEIVPRPFKDVEEMNETLVANYNAVVGEKDYGYFLGDTVMGGWKQNLPIISRLNGIKTLVRGNHDKVFDVKENRKEEVIAAYEEHFQYVVDGNMPFFSSHFAGVPHVTLSHFPAIGDSQRESRYDEHRPEDDGTVVIHGHVHSKDTLTITDNNTIQYHVGVDAHDYAPVHIDKIAKEVREAYDSLSN